MVEKPVEKRSEERTDLDRYYSVEFTIKGVDWVYQFKIRDLTTRGLCVLVKEGSEVLEHLRVGDILTMKYNQSDLSRTHAYFKTEIRHMTRDEAGRFKGHCLVGLRILED